MLEPEMAFCDLGCNMEVAEELIRELVAAVLDACTEDLDLFNRFVSKGLLQKLETVRDQSFVRMTYTEAVDELQAASTKFEFPVKWGIDLQAEHERFLCEELAGRPVIVTNYPKEIKPFYMRMDDDGRTVAAMDVLVPGIGEIELVWGRRATPLPNWRLTPCLFDILYLLLRGNLYPSCDPGSK